MSAATHNDINSRLVHVEERIEHVEETVEHIESSLKLGTLEVRGVRRLAIAAIGASLASADPQSWTMRVVDLLVAVAGF